MPTLALVIGGAGAAHPDLKETLLRFTRNEATGGGRKMLDVIAAVVIGGTLLTGGKGYVLGSLVGVMVYGTINNIIRVMGEDDSWTRIVIGALLLLFIVVQRFVVGRTERRT